MSDSFGTFLDVVNAGRVKENTLKELADLFNEVSAAADEVQDPDLKIRLKVAAAKGQERLKAVR